MHDRKVKLPRRAPVRVSWDGGEVLISRSTFGRVRICAPDGCTVEVVGAAMRPSRESATALVEMTNAELRALLTGMGVDPPNRATKKELLELLQGSE